MSSSLPMFPQLLDPQLDHVFAPMCQAIPVREATHLKKSVISHVETVRKALTYNEFLDLPVAERISNALVELLNSYKDIPEHKRGLVIGAVRYFIRQDDAQADLSSLLGFDDDVTVLNYVLEQVGRKDLKISI